MTAMGTSHDSLMDSRLSKIRSVVTPAESAVAWTPLISGPPAMGSENGFSTITMSTPASAIAQMRRPVVSMSGDPAMMWDIRDFFEKRESSVMEFQPPVACDGGDVLVPASGKVHGYDLVLGQGRGHLDDLCDGM